MSEKIDNGALIIIAVTFVLFAVALVTKGFTHDLLLEAGVFLISVKLIMVMRSNNVSNLTIRNELRSIQALLKKNATNSDK